VVGATAGSCATSSCESSQGRKAAALSGSGPCAAVNLAVAPTTGGVFFGGVRSRRGMSFHAARLVPHRGNLFPSAATVTIMILIIGTGPSANQPPLPDDRHGPSPSPAPDGGRADR